MWWFIFMFLAVSYGGSLKQDKDAEQRFFAKHPKGISRGDLSQKVQNHLENDHWIQALKEFRKETGLGLKDAKEILQALRA